MNQSRGNEPNQSQLRTDGGEGFDVAREIFEQEDNIFSNKGLLEIDHVPSATGSSAEMTKFEC